MTLEVVNTEAMHLKILLPTEILFDGLSVKVIAEAQNGSFCLLPRHTDFVCALVPSILYFYIARDDKGSEKIEQNSTEIFVAIDSGVLIKCGEQVLVSTFNAVRADNIEELKSTVTQRFLNLSEHEQLARAALTRLEAGAIRRFIELEARSF